MSETLQTIFILLITGLAIFFLVRKFVWKPKNKASKSCGNDGCGCH